MSTPAGACTPQPESCDDGSFWLGRPGNLLRIDGGHGSIDRAWNSSTTMHTTAAGQPRAQTSPLRPFREWDVELDPSFVRQHAGLHELLVTDPGPHVFVEPWAQVTNVMTPGGSVLTDQSQLTEYSFGGGWDIATDDPDNPYDRVSRVLLNPAAQGGNDAFVYCGYGPVLAGQTVTGSAYLASESDASILLFYYDANGDYIRWDQSETVTGFGRLHRVSVTGQAPPGTVAARVVAAKAEVVARPAITWTDRVMDWGIGGLAQQCVITDVSDGVLQAGHGSRTRRRAGVSFTIRETGGFVA